MVREITSAADFDALLSSTTYVAVDFFATWCPPCKQIAPFYESLDKKHAVHGTLAFVKLNVEEVREISGRYGITSMPTFMFFKEGKQVAVNGEMMILGADPRKLTAAADKLGGLAKKKAAAAA
jgi:thioredoxin 1